MCVSIYMCLWPKMIVREEGSEKQGAIFQFSSAKFPVFYAIKATPFEVFTEVYIFNFKWVILH